MSLSAGVFRIVVYSGRPVAAGACVFPCNGVNTVLELLCLVLCSGRPLARGLTVSASRIPIRLGDDDVAVQRADGANATKRNASGGNAYPNLTSALAASEDSVGHCTFGPGPGPAGARCAMRAHPRRIAPRTRARARRRRRGPRNPARGATYILTCLTLYAPFSPLLFLT